MTEPSEAFETVETDVAVVGGGLAGLETARRLIDRNVDVRVLEARDRVGGRVFSREIDGEMIDLGAQWIGPGQELVHETVDDFGIGTFEQHVDGVSQFRAGGDIGRHEEVVMALSPNA